MSTVQDVAKLANVSTATVSRVLNGYEGVRPAVAERVNRAIAELNYQPNYAAKALRTSKTQRLILTVPNITNIFFVAIIRAAQDRAQEKGYSLLLGDVGPNGEIDETYAQMIGRREADGMIFLGRHLPESLRDMVTKLGPEAPIVNGCEYSDEMGVCSVRIDDIQAAYDAMAHLLGLGHRCIALMAGDMGGPVSRDRLEGAQSAAKDHKAEGDIQILIGDYSAAAGERLTHDLLQSKRIPTAIFCFSDDMAIGAIKAIVAAGLTCPDDISVMGFDDIPLAQYVTPSLSTERQPTAKMGRNLVDMLLRILNGKIRGREIVTLEHEVVARASTCAPKPGR